MKATKFVVGAGAAFGILAVFLDWMSIEGKAVGLLKELPTSGMSNGGPVFLFLLGFPLLAAAIGAAKRFGRGMATMALLGGLLSAFMALVKYADIQSAGKMAKQLGVTVSVAPGYWILFLGSVLALAGGRAHCFR